MILGLWTLHLVAVLLLPFLLTGLMNRTKAICVGRNGPPLLQSLFDLARLLKKRPVYSATTTPIFRLGPVVVLASTLTSAAFVPVLGGRALIALPFDFVVVAYLWGLGRFALLLAALDTGSALEGMGASRGATFGALVEPVLFIALGALAVATGGARFADLLPPGALASPERAAVALPCALALFVVLQVEASRVPVDDPATHLELTMIHEAMILDHSGPDLAALQLAAAIKMTLSASLVAGALNPVDASAEPALAAIANVGLIGIVVFAAAVVECTTARLRLRSVPGLIGVALFAALVALASAASTRTVG